MKKLFLVLAFFSCISVTKAIPVIEVTKQCGGLFGYSYVHWVRAPYGDLDKNGYQPMGWVGDCSGRGFRGCRPPIVSTNINTKVSDSESDSYDIATANDLIDALRGTIISQNPTGSSTSTYQITGQNFTRVYTVSWSSDPVVCELEDGLSITYIVSVDYVAI